MKKRYRYKLGQKQVVEEYTYIPTRYIIAILISILEVAAVIGLLVALCFYVPYFYFIAWLTQIACVIQIVASDVNPDYKVPWLLVVMALPVAGFMLYFMFYSRTLKRKFVRRLKTIKDTAYHVDDSSLMARLREESPAAHSQAKMLCRVAETHLFTGTSQTYFPLGDDMHLPLLADLKTAQQFIFLEYFIIEEGRFWSSILTILKDKAAGGVTVRLVYDDVGCMKTLPGDYWKTLGKFGIQALPFSRLRGNMDSEFNNRSHRKLCIIDGRVAYTGGVNLADEYINAVVRFGHWKDTALRLEGEAVWELTKLFLIDYGINSRSLPPSIPELFPACGTGEPGYLIPFGDGPHPIYTHQVSKSVLQNLLSDARQYVTMTTPYLIIDNDLCSSIENAALRGVDVRILVPHIPDKKLVFEITRSFYPRLMAAGVKIYEYAPGFLHAKSCLCDDAYAVIGTINLDYRSLVHHFENGVWMYRCAAIADMKRDLEATMEKSILVTEAMLTVPLSLRFLRAVARIFAPLL